MIPDMAYRGSRHEERHDPFDAKLFISDDVAADSEFLCCVSWAKIRTHEVGGGPPMQVRFEQDGHIHTRRTRSSIPKAKKDPLRRRCCYTFSATVSVTIVAAFLALLSMYQQDPSSLHQLSKRAVQVVTPLRRLVLRSSTRQTEILRIGRRDYAFGADGARIAPDLTTGTFHISSKFQTRHSADVILRDNLHGGRCWTIPSKDGQVGVMTSHRIHPTHITIDHIPQEVADDIGQAPRRIRAWAHVEGSHNKEKAVRFQRSARVEEDGPKVKGHYAMFVHLADFEYNPGAQYHVQTFPVDAQLGELDLDYGVFVFEVLDNWGSDSTCIYRIRIHGCATHTCKSSITACLLLLTDLGLRTRRACRVYRCS